MVSIIIVGFGGVGRAVAQMIIDESDYYKDNFNFNPIIKSICELKGSIINNSGIDIKSTLDLKELSESPDWVPNKSALEVIDEIKADFVVECSWVNPETGEPAFSIMKTAIEHKMNVISSNKGPFYLKYHELASLAKENGVSIGIESTVGSAIPALFAKQSLAGAHISGIHGILNGTSNYILSQMTIKGISFEKALNEAQELGYAEADPALDINGYDAAGKLVILANHLLNWNKTIKDVQINGIEQITKEAISEAKKKGMVFKHVCCAENDSLYVGLKKIPKHSTMRVDGSLNIVEIVTKNAGSYSFIGRGAGRPEAASGILSDIINISILKFKL